MLRIAICDNDNAICTQVENILVELSKRLLENIEVEVFFSGEDLYQCLSDGDYFDLIFLEIELQMINGIEVGKKIREMNNETTQIIYISWKDSYAMELFDIRPFNFLIKPLQAEKIEGIVRGVMHFIEREDQFFEFKIGRTRKKIHVKDILYFESNCKKVKMVLQGETYKFYSKISDIKHQLNNEKFIIIHKSYLVNYFHIREYQYDYVKMSDNTILTISQKHRASVRKKFCNKVKKLIVTICII